MLPVTMFLLSMIFASAVLARKPARVVPIRISR